MSEFKVLVETPDGKVLEYVSTGSSVEHAGEIALNASPEGSTILAVSGVTNGLKPRQDRVRFEYV